MANDARTSPNSSGPKSSDIAALSYPELDPNRPAVVFISYSSEDHDLAKLVYQSLTSLGETIYDRVKIFLDSQSISGGDPIQQEIRENLYKSDFLIVVYTGRMKRSHDYAGFEVGFFDALIQEERRRGEPSARKIISLFFFDDPPAVTNSILGISMAVDPQDLGGSCAEYVQKSKRSPDDAPDVLGHLFYDIAKLAQSRLPTQFQDPDLLVKKFEDRKKKVAGEIIPNLKGGIFDCLSTRIARRSIEQKLIEFELHHSSPTQQYDAVPDDAVLTQHADAFQIFGVTSQADSITWGVFKAGVKTRDALGGSSIIMAMEQSLLSAISPAVPIDNEQLIKSYVDGKVYRIIITRQLDYYNGRKVANMYFIEKLSHSRLGNNDTSIILSFVNVAAKYRFIFIEEDSSLSVESFYLEHDMAVVKEMVRQLIRELILIEEEAHERGLDDAKAIQKYFGTGDDLKTAKGLQDNWFKARMDLSSAAEKILGADPASPQFSQLNKQWLATLESFRSTSGEINSTVTTRALKNLEKSFAPKGST